MLDIVKKIDKMRVDRGWTIYKLSQEANISQQNWLNELDINHDITNISPHIKMW